MPGVDIVLYDRNGEPVTYEGIETITTDTPVDGERATFTYGTLLGDVEIGLNFKSGDQKISIPDGSLVKEAVVKKPETLVPGNIANGVEIAGVTGNAQLAGWRTIVEETTFTSALDSDYESYASALPTIADEITLNKIYRIKYDSREYTIASQSALVKITASASLNVSFTCLGDNLKTKKINIGSYYYEAQWFQQNYNNIPFLLVSSRVFTGDTSPKSHTIKVEVLEV